MDYSKTGSVGGSNGARGGKSEVLFKDDWKCSRCGCDNFQRRLQCFKCGLSKAESEKVRAKEPAESRSRSGSSSPSCTLVIRGLDGLTEETGVENALGNVCRNCRIRNVFIVRNGTTGIGEGYGYLEFFSRQEAEDVVETIRSMDCPLEIDGKEVLVDYSREAFATVVASISQSMLNSNLNQGYDYDRNASHRYSSYYGETDVQNAPLVHQSNMSSGNVPKSTQYAKQYMAEPAPLSAETLQPTDTGRQGASFPSGTSVTLSDNEFANYASPDLNRYIFDDLTGYYIDPVTGLYYDAGTQYFYQMETGRFLYWDPDKNCYFPASEQGQETKDKETTTTPAKSAEETALSKQEEERLEKANAAKKIAKEMDKWVKAQNSQKESGFKKPLAPISLPPKAKPSGAADAGFNVIAKSKFTIELPKPKEEKKALAAPALPGLVAYSGDSDSDTEADEDDADRAAGEDAERAVEEKLVDWGKLTCLLCRRAFSSADILTKHRQLSDLHKSNLEEYKRKLTGTVTRATTVAKASGITKSTTAKR